MKKMDNLDWCMRGKFGIEWLISIRLNLRDILDDYYILFHMMNRIILY